jgi:hypothetical protein
LFTPGVSRSFRQCATIAEVQPSWTRGASGRVCVELLLPRVGDFSSSWEYTRSSQSSSPLSKGTLVLSHDPSCAVLDREKEATQVGVGDTALIVSPTAMVMQRD